MRTAAIVLCAGKGTRMKSERAKVLHPLCGQAMCLWVLEEVVALIDGPIVAVVGHQAAEVQAEITKKFGGRITFAKQEQQKGTGDAARAGLEALEGFNGDVFVLYGDTPLLSRETLKLLQNNKNEHQAIGAFLTTFMENPFGYGRVYRNKKGEVKSIVEERDADKKQKEIKEVNAGVYLFDAQFLRKSVKKLKPKNAQHELYLTDLAKMAADEHLVETLGVSEVEVMGINDRAQLAEAEKVLRRRLVNKWMVFGVTCIDPDSTYIDAQVTIGIDTLIEPGVVLQGKTDIGTNVHLGVGVVAKNTTICDGAQIHAYSVCENAIVGKGVSVGPFARLRPGTQLDEKVKIGNFVEVKNSHFKKGSKANHLAYVGDAEVGQESNIGAGTITCNYDGVNKHKTKLGNHVFIGSNSTLVAPLVVEKDSYVAAGSVVTKDVPADTLAIGRSHQENKEGYANLLRARQKKAASK